MKLIGVVKICLNETYSKIHIGKYLLDTFPIQNYMKHRDALLSMLFNFTLEYNVRNVQETLEELKLK
jgi:hypothetical protein